MGVPCVAAGTLQYRKKHLPSHISGHVEMQWMNWPSNHFATSGFVEISFHDAGVGNVLVVVEDF
jgi:hypothetical protein